ncbi:MAG: hypothetical protein GY726_07705 [Proteobacteria bacterium]|nr:hypothetical protein [Pseudomonadota bacterium]
MTVCKYVIPAYAGIYARQNFAFVITCWISAFAGMTVNGAFHLLCGLCDKFDPKHGADPGVAY